MRLEGKVAVVTGGAGGIGAAIVETLAAQGAAVVVNDPGVTVDGREPSRQPADEVVDRVRRGGGNAVAHHGSVAGFDTARELIELAARTFGGMHILVAAHGILRERMIFNMAEDEWADVVDVHLTGTFNCVRFATAHMRESRTGSIVLISSTAGLLGNPAQANYSAAKLGIVGLAWSAALAMGKYDVNVNVIAPSAATRMTARLREEYTGNVGYGGPATVAAVTAALCAPETRHITGQVYSADGNRVARWSHPAEVEVAYQQQDEWTPDQVVDTITSVFTAPPLARFERRGLALPTSEVGPEQGPAG